MTSTSRRALVTLAVALAGILGVVWMAPVPGRGSSAPARRSHQANATRPSAREVAGPHLQRADEQCRAAIARPAADVERFFHDAQQSTGPFAEEALGWGSKWRLVVDHVPYTRGGRHEAFLRAQFEKQVFSPQQLEQAVSGAISAYLAEVRSVEGRMLVDLRTDMADVPGAFPAAALDESEFRQLYEESLALAASSAGGSLQADIGTQMVSLIAGEVLTAVAVRLGVSAGILGTGAATSWATLGVGLVVGVIVDQIVCWVWDWYADPEGELAAQLNSKLEVLRRMIVEGPGGLRERLEQFAAQRAAVRQQAVLNLLEPSR